MNNAPENIGLVRGMLGLRLWNKHDDNDQSNAIAYTRSDLVAEQAAENERLRQDRDEWKRWADQHHSDLRRTEALASTGAVKVEQCIHDWFDCSNQYVLPPAKSCRKCGWTVGADEARGMFVQWPWLAPHPRATNTVDAHETANVSDKPATYPSASAAEVDPDGAFERAFAEVAGVQLTEPTPPESQQEPFGYWIEHVQAEPYFLRPPCYIPSGGNFKSTPLYTGPSEQAVTEADLRAAFISGYRRFAPAAILEDENRTEAAWQKARTAIKAAMEARG